MWYNWRMVFHREPYYWIWFSCFSYRVLVSFVPVHRHGRSGYFNRTQPLFVHLNTPALFFLRKVKMSAVEKDQTTSLFPATKRTSSPSVLFEITKQTHLNAPCHIYDLWRLEGAGGKGQMMVSWTISNCDPLFPSRFLRTAPSHPAALSRTEKQTLGCYASAPCNLDHHTWLEMLPATSAHNQSHCSQQETIWERKKKLAPTENRLHVSQPAKKVPTTAEEGAS